MTRLVERPSEVGSPFDGGVSWAKYVAKLPICSRMANLCMPISPCVGPPRCVFRNKTPRKEWLSVWRWDIRCIGLVPFLYGTPAHRVEESPLNKLSNVSIRIPNISIRIPNLAPMTSRAELLPSLVRVLQLDHDMDYIHCLGSQFGVNKYNAINNVSRFAVQRNRSWLNDCGRASAYRRRFTSPGFGLIS